MSTRLRRFYPVYATVRAEFSNYGFGHLNVVVYNIISDSSRAGTLRISCQTGGETSSMSEKSYAWRYGIAPDCDVLEHDSMHRGNLLMRSIQRKLAVVQKERFDAPNFAEYALRVLRAANVRRVHLFPGVNSSFYGEVDTLPKFDPVRGGDFLLKELTAMETEIIRMGLRRVA